MKTKCVTLSMQDAKLAFGDGDEWRITGMATVFNNVNCYGFAIAPGAYKNVLSSGVKPKMFFNHCAYSVPIGVWDSLKETSEGLEVSGVLTKGVAEASDVYAALKAGTVDGLSVSIGWRSEDEGEDNGVVVLRNVRSLSEISVVTYPADGRARVSQTLSADDIDERIESIKTLRDVESFVRDVANLSKRQSGWLLSKAKAALASEPSRDDGPKELDALAAIFNRVKTGLS